MIITLVITGPSEQKALFGVPDRSPYGQEGAGRHQATDPGMILSPYGHPAPSVQQRGWFERPTSREINLRTRKPKTKMLSDFSITIDSLNTIVSALLTVVLT